MRRILCLWELGKLSWACACRRWRWGWRSSLERSYGETESGQIISFGCCQCYKPSVNAKRDQAKAAGDSAARADAIADARYLDSIATAMGWGVLRHASEALGGCRKRGTRPRRATRFVGRMASSTTPTSCVRERTREATTVQKSRPRRSSSPFPTSESQPSLESSARQAAHTRRLCDPYIPRQH